MNGKKLLLLSDTHGNLNALKAVFNWAKGRIPPNDSIVCTVFLGDGLSDLQTAAKATGFYSDWKIICGNNDYGHSVPGAETFDFCGFRFFMCHGHKHGIYGGSHLLINCAKEAGANAAFFGHTHVPHLETESGILLINPGSAGRPRSRIGATFAVLECTDREGIKAEFYGIGTNKEINKVKIKNAEF